MAWDWLDDSLLGNAGETTNAALRNPIPSFSFVLEVEALYFLALKSVKVFNKENEYEYIQEGGVNDYVHMRRKPISKPFTFQVERYVGAERFLDPLALGTDLVAPVILYVYRSQPRQMITESAPAWPARLYIFTGCNVTAKEYGELNSEKSALLTETTTIAYREMMAVTNPTWGNDSEKELMSFADMKAGKPPLNANATNFKDKDNYEKKKQKFWDGETREVWFKKGADKQREYKDYKTDTKPENARTNSITNDKKIYETKVDNDGVKHLVRKDESKDYNKPRIAEFGEDTEPKWASDQSVKAAKDSYKTDTDKDGTKHIVRNPDGDQFTKNRIDQYGEMTDPKWASDKSVKAAKDSYTTETDKDGIKHRTRTPDGDQFTKKPKTYEDYTKDAKPTWASSRNMDGDTELYKQEPDRDGVKHLVRKPDGEKYTKEAWDMRDNKDKPKPKHSRKSPTDDSKPEIKYPWSIRDNKDKPEPKYAEKSPKDDSKPEAKGPWNIKSPDSGKSAAQSPKDSSKPEAKGPWDIKSPDSGKSAVQSPTDSSKPEAKGPWDIKSPGSGKSAVQSPTDPSKPEVKGPWDIKQNATDPKPKYATPSPKDAEKPEAVKWPPTRRALMAQALSEKK